MIIVMIIIIVTAMREEGVKNLFHLIALKESAQYCFWQQDLVLK